jgi:hypothetical protein
VLDMPIFRRVVKRRRVCTPYLVSVSHTDTIIDGWCDLVKLLISG